VAGVSRKDVESSELLLAISEQQMHLSEPLWDTPTLATRTGQAASTWEKRRLDGTGPQFIKMGRLVRYRPADVDAWLAERVRRSTSEGTKTSVTREGA
jgi:predicted DNA-binding transcriptional regulator AlpA